MNGKVGVHLGIAIRNCGCHQRVFVHDTLDQFIRAFSTAGQDPHVDAGQALARQSGQPFLRHDLAGSRWCLAKQRGGIKHTYEGPGDKFGVHFPAQAVLAQIHSQVS